MFKKRYFKIRFLRKLNNTIDRKYTMAKNPYVFMRPFKMVQEY